MQRSAQARSAALWACLLLVAAQTPGEEGPCSSCAHGTCKQDENTSQYSCLCLAGWSGPDCNISTAPAPGPAAAAATSRCGACVHGSCTQGFNTAAYICQCQAGWSGQACNVSSASPAAAPAPVTVVASSSACQPACFVGYCNLLSNGSSVCDCAGTGYSGPACSVPGASSATPNGNSREPGCQGCSNGARCVEAPNTQQYYCECSGTGYTGVNCTQPATQTAAALSAPPPPSAVNQTQEDQKAGAAVPKSLDAGAVAGIILAIAVAIGLATVGVLLWRQPRRNGTRFDRFDSDMEIPSSRTSKSSLG